MFDFDAGKLLIVGVIALIFIPPKDLPRALRTAGQFVGKMRRMAADFQSQFMDAMREADMADVRREAQKLAESARLDHGLHDVEHTMTHTSHNSDAHVPHDEKPADPAALDYKPEDGQLAESKLSEGGHPKSVAPPHESKAETASHTA